MLFWGAGSMSHQMCRPGHALTSLHPEEHLAFCASPSRAVTTVSPQCINPSPLTQQGRRSMFGLVPPQGRVGVRLSNAGAF